MPSAAAHVARRYVTAADARSANSPPLASFAFGAAGVAYFLMRHARFGGGDESLEAAQWWVEQAERDRGGDAAFAIETGPLSGRPGAASRHYGEPGIWWVAALVGSVANDGARYRRAAARFAQAAARAAGEPGDVTSGSAGLLLGCADLVARPSDTCSLAPIRVTGQRLAMDLADLAEREGPTLDENTLGYLGAAHGWAGVAYALLRWSSAISAPPPPSALSLLERLAAVRRPSGRWPIRIGSREVRLGWCHGAAGWAQLWTLAWELTDDDRFLGFATHAAADAVATEETTASLCCGRAGEAYAALTLYRATREPHWLSAARGAATDAARLAQGDHEPGHRLLSGALGVALLQLELEDPLRSAMPAYEAIR